MGKVDDAEVLDECADVWPSINNVEKGSNVADRGRVSNGQLAGPIKVMLGDIKKCGRKESCGVEANSVALGYNFLENQVDDVFWYVDALYFGWHGCRRG